MESVRESETFPALEIDIGVLLATWIDLISERIRESSKEEWLVIELLTPESITQVLEVVEIKAKLELHY